MKKNNKKISSSDLKLWNQILDKVEPIKNLVDPKLQIKKKVLLKIT